MCHTVRYEKYWLKNVLFKIAILVVLAVPKISIAQNSVLSDNVSSKPGTLSSGFIPTQVNGTIRISTTLQNNVSAHIGLFDPWVGVYYERLLFPFWGFDAAIGLLGASIGTKVYVPRLSNGKISFYTGISEGMLLMVGSKHYIPVGLTFLGNNGFRISFDLGPQIYHDKNEENQFGLTLKMGKSF
jgi:hypothetical protein